LIGGVAIEYVATRLASTAFASPNGSTPGRQAIAQWIPIAAVAAIAISSGQPMTAIALIFGSSVACLSLILGMTAYTGPVAQLPPERRVWSLVLPVSVLLLLAGFRAQFTWYHAVMLLVMGVAILFVWLDRPGVESAPEPTPVLMDPFRVGLLMAAVVLAILGAWVATRGVMQVSSRVVTPELLGATILSPLLLLPALSSGTMLAQHGNAHRAVTSLCGTVFLNLCLLLPLTILIHPALRLAPGTSPVLAYPLITWRVDTVVLLLLAFALIPMSAGRWMPSRLEAMLLVVVYAAYLIAETAISARLLQ
ncbi:MAG TPA: hypothetical protein VLJ39_22065, partial [Tepidisphaeraceae bacterium]|nr:hypothetical protein [Tepidisphaeraceae bacterium]